MPFHITRYFYVCMKTQLLNTQFAFKTWKSNVFIIHLKPVLWYCSKEYLPSGRPLAQDARTKALAITTFASCILVIPVPVLWSSLV